MNWDEQLEGNEDAASDDNDVDQGEAFDYRVNIVPAFAGNGADILRLPHGLKVVPTPWNGEAAQDGAHIAMRFRRGPHALISNSKLVKWSDGSFTLQVGNEVFPVSQVPCLFFLLTAGIVTFRCRTCWMATTGLVCLKTLSTSCCSLKFNTGTRPIL